MDASNYLNIIGLALDVSGACLVFFNSPKTTYQTHMYQSSEIPELVKKADKQNNLAKFGFLLLFIGFMIQLISNFFS